MHLSGSQEAQSVTSLAFFKICMILIICLYTCMWPYACECSTLGVQKRVSDTLELSNVGSWKGLLSLHHRAMPLALSCFLTIGHRAPYPQLLKHFLTESQWPKANLLSINIFFQLRQSNILQLPRRTGSFFLGSSVSRHLTVTSFSLKNSTKHFTLSSHFLTTAFLWGWDCCDECLLAWQYQHTLCSLNAVTVTS